METEHIEVISKKKYGESRLPSSFEIRLYPVRFSQFAKKFNVEKNCPNYGKSIFYTDENIGLIIINKAVFLLSFCLILSCSKEDNPIKQKIVGVKLDKFIKDSNYQTINKQKNCS